MWLQKCLDHGPHPMGPVCWGTCSAEVTGGDRELGARLHGRELWANMASWRKTPLSKGKPEALVAQIQADAYWTPVCPSGNLHITFWRHRRNTPGAHHCPGAWISGHHHCPGKRQTDRRSEESITKKMSTMRALSPLHSLGGVSWLQRSKARPMSIQEERWC